MSPLSEAVVQILLKNIVAEGGWQTSLQICSHCGSRAGPQSLIKQQGTSRMQVSCRQGLGAWEGMEVLVWAWGTEYTVSMVGGIRGDNPGS